MSDTLSHTDIIVDERALFRRIAAGDERAFGEFFYRYNTRVFYFALNIVELESLAEEVVQDVFLKLWLSREMLTEVANPGNYLFVMAKNRSLNQLERLATERKFAERMKPEAVGGVTETEERLWYKESLALVEEAVRRLPEQQRKIFRLSKLEGLSREEIATRLNLSPHTVKNHLGAAVKTVQEYLLAHGRIVTILLFLHFLGKN